MESSLLKTNNIHDDFQFDKQLGSGTFATVFKGINRETLEEVAIKIFDKALIEQEDRQAIELECEIMASVDHPNIVKIIAVYDNPSKLAMVMELMEGGDLFDRIIEREAYSEDEAREIIKPIIDGLFYCHQMGIVHRDLKPENILYSSWEKASTVKISDFGLAKVISDELLTTACGSPSYIAPEILSGEGYSFFVDYWSLGIILYLLLCGFPPFYEETNKKLFEAISKGEVDFPSPHWDEISHDAKDLIACLLRTDPAERFAAEEILAHRWMNL